MQVYYIELFLFYAITLGILFLPLRWGLLCLLLAGCIEVIPPGFVAATSVSWQNAAGRLLLPMLLLLRLTGFRPLRIRWSFASKLWSALILYAAISILWSPFKLPGFKMVAYLAAWFVLYLIFDLAWRRGLLDQKLLIAALWGSLALAFFQTCVLGNPLFGAQGRFGEFASAQFAPFTGPQSFGPFLACLLALLLFSRERNSFRSVSIATCLVALVLVGSRYSLIEAGVIVSAWGLLRAKAIRMRGGVRITRVAEIAALVVTVLFGFGSAMAWVIPNNRVNQLFEMSSQPDLAEAGTFGWRLVRYERTLTDLVSRSPEGLTFGSGTSSGAQVAMADQQAFIEGVDPNRAIHDEFLRALYEWGIIGLGLGLTLLIYATRELWKHSFHAWSLAGFAGLSIMPGIILALLVENPLAGPGTAQSFGYLLVLTYGFTGGGRVSAAHARSGRLASHGAPR